VSQIKFKRRGTRRQQYCLFVPERSYGPVVANQQASKACTCWYDIQQS